MKTIQTILFLLLSIGVYSQPPKAYITNFGDNFISVVDLQNRQKIIDIKTGNKPHGVAVSPDGNLIAVSNEGDNTVSIISTTSNIVIQTVQVGKLPHQLSFSLDGKYILSAINAEHKVDVISTVSYKIVNSIAVGRNPHIVLPMADGKNAWVTSEGDNKIVKINLDEMKVVAEIPVFGFPRVMTQPLRMANSFTLQFVGFMDLLKLMQSKTRSLAGCNCHLPQCLTVKERQHMVYVYPWKNCLFNKPIFR